jgi:hypothetical protein
VKKLDPYKRQKAYRRRKPWNRLVEFARRRCKSDDPKYKPFYKDKGIEVHMNVDDAEFLWKRDNAAALKHPSLDRIDSTKHYTRDNCRVIEMRINAMLAHGLAPEEE